MYKFNSLKSALAFRFVLGATLPLIVFGWFGYNYLSSQQLREADADLQSHSLDIRDEVSHFIEQVQSDLLVTRDIVELLLEDRPAQIDSFLQRMANNSKIFEALYVLDEGHRVRFLGLLADSGAQPEDYQGIDFSRMEFFAVGNLPEGHSHPLPKRRVANNGFEWSDIFVSPVTGNPTVMINLPLPDGNLMGAVSLEFLVNFLQRRLRQSEAMEFALVDHHGTLIAHTHQHLALERNNLLMLHPEILRVLASGEDLPSNRHEDGSMLESARTVPDTGWVIHASLPRKMLQIKSRQLYMVMVSSVFGAALAGGLLALWQSRRLIRPLTKLREGAQYLAKGNAFPPAQSPRSGYAEIDDLSRHIEEMAGAVQERETYLRASEERYRQLSTQFSALLDGITDRIDLIAPDLTLLWTNQRGSESQPGWDEKFPSGCCFASRFNRSEPCQNCPALRCFASGEREAGESINGQERIYSLRAFPVKDELGRVVQVIMISEDVTEKRASEQQQIRANQLASLGELAAGVAHEINNPINGVINYAQLIVNYTDTGEREHDLAQRIIKEGDRVATIVRELLIFAREEDQEIRRISLREALGEALVLCESQLRKEHISLRIQMQPDLPLLESRSHQVEQLILNLLVNARHALAEKYPDGDADKVLEVSGEQIELEGQPFVRIRVRDHGTGIPAELLGKVLNPFFTTKPAGVGTGLGLSISFEIAKRHGGSLRLVSEYGRWTEAVVDLPAVPIRKEEYR